MENGQILVTAGIIRNGDYFLISQRKSDSFLAPNLWEFPGGKIKHLEHPEDCLIREIEEELNIKISVEKLHSVSSHVYEKESGKHHVLIVAFLANYVSGDLKNVDCQNSKWVKLSEFKDYDFVPADIPIVNQLLSDLNS